MMIVNSTSKKKKKQRKVWEKKQIREIFGKQKIKGKKKTNILF